MASIAAGSASDDGDAGSAGETSEGGKAKKLKLNAPKTYTPQGSRSGSPAQNSGNLSGSRASSPEGAAAKGKSASFFFFLNHFSDLLRRSRQGLYTKTVWVPGFPNCCRNPCCDTPNWYSQRRLSPNLQTSHWRVEGESPSVY